MHLLHSKGYEAEAQTAKKKKLKSLFVLLDNGTDVFMDFHENCVLYESINTASH